MVGRSIFKAGNAYGAYGHRDERVVISRTMNTTTTLSLTAILFSAGCSAPTGLLSDVLVPEFSLLDQNSTSVTFGEEVSPSLMRGQVSAWYFGHAT
jgi:hypothetical protein